MAISKTEADLRQKYKPRERKFETPYGHLAAMEWGNPDAPHKILCLHGWLDNAGSFERIIPFILDHANNSELYHIVAFDMPGVGLSSHLPPGSLYTQFVGVVETNRIVNLLKWDKVTLLSHSLGAHISFMYSCIYPKQVQSMISIDLTYPMTRRVQNWNVFIANSIEEHFKCEYHHEDDPTTNMRVPVYSEVDALKRLMESHSSSLNEESARVMLKRGAKKQRWGYTFSRDLRLRYFSIELLSEDEPMIQRLAGPFEPNLLIIRAKSCPYPRPEDIRLKFYDIYKKNCPIFKDAIIEGTHHLHMNNPDTVAPEICKFLDEVRISRESIKSNL